MLKDLIINGKRVPVPVPLQNLEEALSWISQNLVARDSSLTLVELNGKEVELDAGAESGLLEVPLGPNARLSVKIDSPMTLAIQSVDAIRNLASITEPVLKPLAVSLWQVEKRPLGNLASEIDQLQGDIGLLCDLLGHVMELAPTDRVDLHELTDSQERLRTMSTSITMAINIGDFRAISRVLLNRIEPELAAIINAAVAVQNQLYQAKASENPIKPGDCYKSNHGAKETA